MAKKLVKIEVVNGKEVNYEVTVDAKNMVFNANRMGAFTCLHRNFNGRQLYGNTLNEMKVTWGRLIEEGGYTVEEVKVSAPKQSLYVMKFEIDGKEVSGRKLWSRKYSEIRHSMITDDIRKLTGKELREAMEKIDKDAKKATREWEADYIASLQ